MARLKAEAPTASPSRAFGARTEARATIEAGRGRRCARIRQLNLNLTNLVHWNEAPYLHVLGRGVESRALCRPAHPAPRLRALRSRINSHNAEELNLRDKASAAAGHIVEPDQAAMNRIWLQVTPRGAAFAGVRANDKVL